MILVSFLIVPALLPSRAVFLLSLNCSGVWAVGFNPSSCMVQAIPLFPGKAPLLWSQTVHGVPLCTVLTACEDEPCSWHICSIFLGNYARCMDGGAMACCSSSPWDLAAFLSFPSLVRNSCLLDRRVSARLLLLISLGQVLPC